MSPVMPEMIEPPDAAHDAYTRFLHAKVAKAPTYGFDVALDEIHPVLKPHQQLTVQWAVKGGRRAIFHQFGLGKTLCQLEILRLILRHVGGRGLIVLPLGVRQEFVRDAAMLGIPVRFIRRIDEAGADGIYLTNYETVRDGKLDPRQFTAASLDEGSTLRSFGGTRTFREFMRLFAGDGKTFQARVRGADVPYRFVATATPSPNAYIELLAYAAFLGVGDVAHMKTRFFRRNAQKADDLSLHPHKVFEFYAWLRSWALFLEAPADLTGNPADNAGYTLPPIQIQWHELPTDHRTAGAEQDGQLRLLKNAALGVVQASREKRESLPARVAYVQTLVQQYQARNPTDQLVIWCDLNAEHRAIERALRALGVSYSSLYGSQSLDERERLMERWRRRETTVLLSKPMMYGAGVNLQQSHIMIFAGIGFKFQDMIQATKRIHRYLQGHQCEVHFLYTEAERDVRRILERKWHDHEELMRAMTETIHRYGLSHAEMAKELTRAIGVERVEVTGEHYRLVNNDCVRETRQMPHNSVDLIVTSPPFSTQFEYSPNYADLGHSDTNEHFFQHLDFLTPELFRILQPGRIAAIHVKDRVVPGGLTGLGFQTIYPFHAKCIEHFVQHGFAYMGMKTIVTDVVRENKQTHRLGWTEQCKDGTKMGVGLPEYLLVFRKPPTDNTRSYADVPVVKDKQRYTRARWQVDAHGFARSNGDRPITAADLDGIPHDAIFQLFKRYYEAHVYDFEHHVRLGEALEAKRKLPVTFMLLQPPSWHPDVWTDVARMLSLNTSQHQKGKELHLAPLPFDIVDRVIEQFSMPGETVFDPFVGIGTVVYRALLKRRRGIGVELSAPYFLDAASYCKAAEQEMSMPTLLDIVEHRAGPVPQHA